MKKFCLLLLVSMIGIFAFAQIKSKQIPQDFQALFISQTDTLHETPILYREIFIHSEKSDSATLVIFLHSAGGRGNDNKSHLNMPAVRNIYNYLEDHGIKAHFLVPQCPRSASWNGISSGSDHPRGDGSSPHRPLFDENSPKLSDKTPFVSYLIPVIQDYIIAKSINPSKIIY